MPDSSGAGLQARGMAFPKTRRSPVQPDLSGGLYFVLWNGFHSLWAPCRYQSDEGEEEQCAHGCCVVLQGVFVAVH